MFPLLLLCAALSTTIRPAIAQANGVVVRIHNDGTRDGPFRLRLLEPTGASTPVLLRDDGQAPDVKAGDHIWSGAAFPRGHQFALAVEVGAELTSIGTVNFDGNSASRDINVEVNNGHFSLASTEAPTLLPAPLAPQAPQAQVITATGPIAASVTSTAPPHPILQALGALLAMTTLGTLLWWWRLSPSGTAAQDPSLVREPPAPLFGPGTPAVPGSVSLWGISEEDLTPFVAAIAQTLAIGNIVVIAASAERAFPAIRVGTLFRTHERRPSRLVSMVTTLREQRGRSVVLLYILEELTDGTLARLYTSITPETGALVVLVNPGEALPGLLTVTATPTGYTLSPNGLSLTLGQWGLVVETSA